MKCYQKANHTRDEEDCPWNVKLRNAFFPAELGDPSGLRYWLEKEDHDCDSDATDRKIDVKAPSPRYFRGKCTSQQWTNNRRYSVHPANKSVEAWPFWQRYGSSNEHIGARKNTGRAYTGDGTTDYKGNAVGSNATDERSQLEDSNGNQEYPLQREEGVELAENELEGGSGEEVSYIGGQRDFVESRLVSDHALTTTVPPDVVETLELIGNLGNSCRNDGTVECDKEY